MRLLGPAVIWAVFLMTASIAAGGTSVPRLLTANMQRVADRDTLTAISQNGTKLRVRLLGIDAPEVPHAKKPGQP